MPLQREKPLNPDPQYWGSLFFYIYIKCYFMGESLLQKEFNERDLSRIRNLIKKDYNAGTRVQVGYEKDIVEHSEGEIWEENGKTWTIKNGVKQSISKLEQFKKQYLIPLTCPNCSKPMKSQVDEKMYRVHSKCLNCVTEMETKLKIEGKYEEYKNNMLKNNVLGGVDMYKEWLIDEASNNDTESFITEDGSKEDWGKSNKVKDKIFNEVLPELEKIRKTWLDDNKENEETKPE